MKTSELRTSVAMQRIKLQQARQAHKLRSILSTHAIHLENWETLEEEHSNAFTGCMEALESAILRVPVTGGARADVQAVKEALNSAVDVLNAVEGSVQFLLPKTESMEALLSQLAETTAQERALLEECGDLLSVAASLEHGSDAIDTGTGHAPDGKKSKKYEELFPVETKRFGYVIPQAKSREAALDERVKKKADRYCK
ncbi:hypothetical protein KC19_6G158800 [Ceratodon purpureus]|uniref:Uncharacterized protein n=1 Tax=Ceratodon purpureus TaxID=3225 RepID=A0A8T0HIZ0_CERPU|nr:hypothetical protein KC19_6G158800 [Ceratodon purpureus]